MSARLPPSASVAQALEGAKLHAPAAERNAQALSQLLALHAPRMGQALEIASGTGQHIAAFAQTLPNLTWQPTEIDAARRASIDAYAAEAEVPNIRPALHLDATVTGWSKDHRAKDLIVMINLLHLISDVQAETLISEAMAALSPRGQALFYGPFKRGGHLTSDGDSRFDADLRGANPAIGYKDDTQIKGWLEASGAKTILTVEMPANNLAFIVSKNPA